MLISLKREKGEETKERWREDIFKKEKREEQRKRVEEGSTP